MAARFLTKPELDANRFFVLATYRHLLRATRIAFQTTGHDPKPRRARQTPQKPGDRNTLLAARKFARENFNKDRRLEPGSVEAAQGIEHAQGVTKILRENVVQGEHKGGDLYKLHIHEHTQRMDNQTATQLKGTTKTFKEIKNSQF